MTIVITESALDDIAEGYLFYEDQYPGLGDYFESSVLSDVRSLILYAGIHELHFTVYFRKLTSRFPYAIYYTVEFDEIRIHAVFDTRRNPTTLRERLG